jgi:hypothetical protein
MPLLKVHVVNVDPAASQQIWTSVGNVVSELAPVIIRQSHSTCMRHSGVQPLKHRLWAFCIWHEQPIHHTLALYARENLHKHMTPWQVVGRMM